MIMGDNKFYFSCYLGFLISHICKASILRFEHANHSGLEPIGTTNEVSVLTCSAKCYGTTGCRYIGYSPKNHGNIHEEGTCYLLDKRPVVVEDESPDNIFFLLPFVDTENMTENQPKGKANSCTDYCETKPENGNYWFNHTYSLTETMRIQCSCWGSARRLVILRGINGSNIQPTLNEFNDGYERGTNEFWMGTKNLAKLIENMGLSLYEDYRDKKVFEKCGIKDVSTDGNYFDLLDCKKVFPYTFGEWSPCDDGGWWWGCDGKVNSISPIMSVPFKTYAVFLS